MKNRKRTLTYFEIFAYGTGGIFINLAGVCDQFGMYFLTNVAMLPAAVVGSMMMLGTVFDAVNDPIIGGIVDRHQSRIGKYRPFLLFGGFLTAMVSVLRYMVPDLGQTGKIVYYMILLCLFSVGFTACTLPWQAMMSVLTPDYHERNVLLSTRSISGNLVGMLINGIILTCVARLGGNDGNGWWKFMAIAWAAAIPFIVLCQYGMKRVDYKDALPSPPRQPFFSRLRRLLSHKPVLCLSAAVAISSVVISLSNVCEMYYYEYVLHDTGVLARTSVFGAPVTIACALLMPFLLKWIDKRQLILIGFGISLIKPAAIAVFGASLSADCVVVLIIISRAGTALFSAAIYAWTPECIDWVNYKDGIACAGLITAASTFMMKLGRALGQTTAGWLMSIAGFSAGAEVTGSVVAQILRINGIYPIIGLCLTMIPLLLFPISHRQAAEIRDELAARDN